MNPERIARVLYKNFDEVKAISLYGSHGYGYADRHTDDFDLAAFAEPIPSKKERNKVLKPLIKRRNSIYDIFPQLDVFDAGKYKDSCIWWTEVNTVNNWKRDFQEKRDVNPQMVDYIYRAKILYDPEKLLKDIKEAMKDYPDELRKKEISKLNAVFRLTRGEVLRKEQARGNWNYLNSKLAQETQTLQSVAYALNREYWSSSKWSFRDYEKFRILPKDYLKGLEILNGPEGAGFQEKIKVLDHLAEEVLKIAKKEVPGAKVRTKF
jgi:hypothetical protein